MQNRFFSVLTRILVLGKFFFAILLSHAIPTLISKVQAQPTISGRIANARTGFGILSVDLDVFDESGNSVSITGGRSGTDGLYTITLPGAGRYIVRADPSVSDFFVDQYFNGVFLPRQATVLELGSTTTRTGVDFRLDTGYLIRGTVRSGGTPLAGIDLDLFSSTGEFLSGYPAVSSTNGTFSVGALPAGTYYLRATPSIAAGQYYVPAYVGGAFNLSNATPLTITAGDLNNVVIDLVAGGGISGQIADKITQTGLENIDLDVFDSLGNFLPYSAHTDNTGAYVIGPIPPGQYKVKADPTGAQNHAGTYYPGTLFRAEAVPVSVIAGQTKEGINIPLDRAGTIRGRIVDDQTSAAIAGVDLDVFDAGGRLLEPTTVTDATGNYVLESIPEGAVYVFAQPARTSGHIARFSNGAETIGNASPVQINPGQETTVDFRLDVAGWIEGKVVNRTGSPLTGIDLDVYQFPTGERVPHTTRTKDDGTFVLGPLVPGGYGLRCDPEPLQGYARTYYPNTFFRSAAQGIIVNAQAGTRADFTLDSASAISGKITDAGSGAPVEGIDLDIFDATGQELDITVNSDAAGNYLLGPVPEGNYFLRADPGATDGRLQQYYTGSATVQGATQIVVHAPTITTNINFALSPAGWISGVVTNKAGAALAEIDLDVFYAETGERVLVGDLTDTNGSYRIGPIPPGNYVVRCDPAIQQGYAVAYYSGQPTKALATLIAVQAFSETGSINFGLDPGASIDGRVIANDSAVPLSGVIIHVFQAGSLARLDSFARTGTNGQFQIGPLPLGSYVLSATPDSSSNYVRTFYPSTTEPANAQTIVLATGGQHLTVEVRQLTAAVTGTDLTMIVEKTDANGLRISANGPLNRSIQLQTSARLGGSWVDLENPAANVTGSVTWQVPITSSNQFFKALLK